MPVRIGETFNHYTEVILINQLEKHKGIVVKGAFYLQAELKKGEAGHVH